MGFFRKVDYSTARNDAKASAMWYTSRSKQARNLYQLTEVAVLVAGALVPVSTIVTDAAIAPALLGATIVVLTGLRKTFNWHDNWVRFSAARAALQTEDVKFEHRIAPYDRDDASDVLALRVRDIEEAETQKWMVLREVSRSDQQGSSKPVPDVNDP